MGNGQALRSILILDDDEDYRKLLLRHLGELFPGVELEEYDPVARGIPGADFDWSRYDVLLLDYNLSLHNVTGLEILKTHGAKPAFPAAIMLTGAGNEDLAIMALKSGVYDYLRKHKLNKEQLKKAVIDAHGRHLAAKKQQDAVNEMRKAASKAAARAVAEFKARYETLHAAELDRLRQEQEKLRKDLEQSRLRLQKVEDEKREAVASLEDIEQELMKFRKGAAGKAAAVIRGHEERREQLNSEIDHSEQKRQDLEGEIKKNLWRQGQEQIKLEQIEEDLRIFNEEFGPEKSEEDDMELAREFKKMQNSKAASRQTERMKQEQDLLADVSSQLQDPEKKK